MLLGVHSDQYFIVASSNEQTNRRGPHPKCIDVIDAPYVVEHYKCLPPFQCVA
jgi:hypothetical protein